MAAYFGYAERHQSLVEDRLTKVFGSQVHIAELQTTWIGMSPALSIIGFRVEGDTPNADALSFDRATVMISPSSLFTFWPRFTEFVVERPSLEIVTLPNNKLKIAGITLSGDKRPGVNRERLLSWLLDQYNAAWHDGDIRWRKSDGSVQRYSNISFVYERLQQVRSARGVISTPKGRVSAALNVDGNPMLVEDWDASVELISGLDQQLLKPGDLSFQVKDGIGNIRLAKLNVDSIRDFLSLSGLAEKTRWILDAQLSGLLHDVEFGFRGALTNLTDWSLKASATDIDFRSLESLPALTNLNGELKASKEGGSFNFAAVDSTFEWSKLYEASFPISNAEGQFTWKRVAEGLFHLSLNQGRFSDPNLSIYDLNADLIIDNQDKKVSSLGDLFKVDAVDELSFENGDVIAVKASDSQKPLVLDATAKFDVANMNALSGYLPNVDKVKVFRSWLSKAYKAGSMSNGRASYKGELSPSAMQEGNAELRVSADFDSVIVDYAPAQDWPPATDTNGHTHLVNDFLTVTPSVLNLNGEPVTDTSLTIENIFSRDSLLKLQGKGSMSLAKGMAFVFQGPLIKREKRPEVLPVEPLAGSVDIDVAVELPLQNTKGLKVSGTATINDASVMLTEGVPLTELNSVVNFTEKTVSSDQITAQFLGGLTTAKLVTTEQTSPPKMQLQGSGIAQLDRLSPWAGEHLLTLFSGESQWQGTVDIDGSNLLINTNSDLRGVTVSAPQPLAKEADTPSTFSLKMNLGGKRINGNSPMQSLEVEYGDLMRAEFQANPMIEGAPKPSLLDRGLVQVGQFESNDAEFAQAELSNGIHFSIEHSALDVDELVEAVIDLAVFEPINPVADTEFLDALRSVSIVTPSATAVSRPFGALDIKMTTKDGWDWAGSIAGDSVSGRFDMQPRDDIGQYSFDLEKLIVGPVGDIKPPVEPINKELVPADFPAIRLTIDSLYMDGRSLGALDFYGLPEGDVWKFDKFVLVHNGIRTTAAGDWSNTKVDGSVSSFDFSTSIDEAEGVLNDMDFNGYVRKGRGSIEGTVEWPGAPYEFEYSRLNGKFDLFVKDGELVQVEPGSGKLLGLLNFNTIARRLVFDFRDVFASGLQFDRMRYRGLLSNGEAILQDAYILTPAVFVRMEGKLDLDKELIDMDVHLSPELGGNLTLLSALANPTAGALVFLTSQFFKDDMRRASFVSYQAKGTWEDFEMVEIDSEGNPLESKGGLTTQTKQSSK